MENEINPHEAEVGCCKEEIQESDEDFWKNHFLREEPHVPKILLVEDEVLNQNLIRMFCEQNGWLVAVAGDGKRALEILEEEEVDLVLLDIQLPEMNGFEVARRIRASGHADLPIIAATALSGADVEKACLAAGMNGYLRKPLDFQKMKEVVARWLKEE